LEWGNYDVAMHFLCSIEISSMSRLLLELTPGCWRSLVEEEKWMITITVFTLEHSFHAKSKSDEELNAILGGWGFRWIEAI
jgi:hypothetical protein